MVLLALPNSRQSLFVRLGAAPPQPPSGLSPQPGVPLHYYMNRAAGRHRSQLAAAAAAVVEGASK
ncbi:hypothetical protein RP20_CCG012552 [Aedes albopictus]|nr:hypothetical protein RP20_CCG012552 [Aedes albopictus]